MPKVHMEKSETTKKKEARQKLIEEMKGKANPTNRELKELLIAIYEEVKSQ
ncbi:MAG: hypothetical protein SCK28_04575 [Bacillota bacterium]|nr:hypothetical protein [Bacillota bacterium]